MRVRDLALRLRLEYVGDGELEITGAAPLESAGACDLAFAGSRRTFAAADSSQAGCIVAPADWVPSSERTFMRSHSPRGSFAAALQILYPPRRAVPGIHPSAIIEEGAELADDVSVGPQVVVEGGARLDSGVVIGSASYIGANTKIGAKSVLHSGVRVYPDVEIGQRCVLHSGCVLGADGFGFVLMNDRYEKFPQVGRVLIGDDCEIGANACIDRAALGVTSIGTGTKLDNMVHIGHNCNIGRHVVIAAQTGISGGVVVEDYAVIGGQVGIGDKARIESRAVLGSGSGVLTSKIVRSGEVVWGTPARPLKQYLRQLAASTRVEQMRTELIELRRKLAEIESRLA